MYLRNVHLFPCNLECIDGRYLFLLTVCDVTGTFRCTFCQAEVEEDESICPDAKTLVARFNEQIEPIYALLRETEDVNLSHDLLEPEPTEIPALKQRSLRRCHCFTHSFVLLFTCILFSTNEHLLNSSL